MSDEEKKPPKRSFSTSLLDTIITVCTSIMKKLLPAFVDLINDTIEIEIEKRFRQMHKNPDRPVVLPYKLTDSQVKEIRQRAIAWAVRNKAEDLIPLIERSDANLLVDINSESPVIIEATLTANFLDPDLPS